MWNIQLFKLNFDHRESDAVASVVNSGWLSMGEETKMAVSKKRVDKLHEVLGSTSYYHNDGKVQNETKLIEDGSTGDEDKKKDTSPKKRTIYRGASKRDLSNVKIGSS